jgi:hypothetical protein
MREGFEAMREGASQVNARKVCGARGKQFGAGEKGKVKKQ